MSGKGLLFFPTPYPDEILYSVLCRYWIRAGRPSPRSIMEDFYGARRDSNILTPRYLGRIASLLPASSGMDAEFFLKAATVFPYFQPFLTQKRTDAYRGYLSNSLPDSKSLYFSLGMGKLRYPRTNYLRFCAECWKEDVKKYGEPYWRRQRQLPGVMVCPAHRQPLMATTITMLAAGKSFYPAEERLIGQSQTCGAYSDGIMEKLALIASDSAWLLQNGMDCGSYDTSFQVLRGLEGSENQRLQAIEKRGGIFSDFEVRGQRDEKYLLTNQTPQGKARPLGTGTPQGAKVPAGIRKELYSGITQS